VEIDPRKFCKVCYDRAVARADRAGLKGRAVFDLRVMKFPCKIPTYTHDVMGRPMVIILDCASGTRTTLTQVEYRRRVSAGEL